MVVNIQLAQRGTDFRELKVAQLRWLDQNAESGWRIRKLTPSNSPEFRAHKHISFWAGP